MSSCFIEISGKKYTEKEVYDKHRLGEGFNDAVIPIRESTALIPGVPLKMQLEVADSIANEVLMAIEGFTEMELEKSGSVNSKEIQTILDQKKNKVLSMISRDAKILQDKIERHRDEADAAKTDEARQEALRKANATYKNLMNIQNVLQQYYKLENMALRMLAARNILNFKTNSTDQFVEFLEENDFRNFNEDFSFERDLKDSLSLAMKAFLSNIRKVGPGNKPETNWLGEEVYYDMNDVYVELQHILSGKFPDAEAFKEELKKYLDAKPWLQEVLDRLDVYEKKKGDMSVTYAFVRAFTSHPVNMLFIQYTLKPVQVKRTMQAYGRTVETYVTEYVYEAEIVESNRNTLTNVLLENWQTDHFYADIFYNENNESYLREGTAAEFQAILDSEQTPREIFRSAMEYIDINISDSLLNRMEKEGILIGNKVVSLNDIVRDKGRYLHKIKDLFANWESSKTAFSKENLFDPNQMRSFFRSLAKADSKYNDMAFASSFRSGNKSLSAFGLNRYAVTKLRDLITNRDGIRSTLKKFKFNNNLWLSLMDDENLINFFDIPFYADVSMFRKLKGSGNRDKELKDMSKDEHFQAMLDLFFNNGLTEFNADKTKEYRIIKSLYLTMSDKKNKYILSHPTEIVNDFDLVDNNGNLNDAAINHLVQTIFMPEYARILQQQENKKNGINNNISGFNEGFNKFYFMPFLHKVEDLFEENGDVKNILDYQTNQDSQAILQQVVKAIKNNVNEEFKIFKENTPEDLQISEKYTDVLKKFLGNEISPQKISDTTLADFFVTTMVTNMRIAQNISGDPALAYKKSKSKKEGADKVLDDIKSSWDNYGKRLAKDNASGYESESSKDPLFGDDKEDNIKTLSLQNAEIGSEYAKMLKHKGYENFDSTDAQALMSLDEFAYQLYKQGGLTTQEYMTIKQAYYQDKEIEDPVLLNKLLRPIKPVIVADIRDETLGVEQKVYIKFSAYPLIPQMTKGTEMEGLRLLMKEKKFGLAAFSSAIKLGNVLSPLKVFDDQRNFIPQAEDVDFESVTIRVPREGWKIQQAVPDKDIDLINRGTQFAKLLFANLRGLKVSPEINIDELEKEYDDLYRQLFKLKAEQLKSELYKNVNGKYVLNFEKFKEIISQELLDRKYDTNTLEYFKMELSEFADGTRTNYEYPFWAIPVNKKIQPVIQSIIDSRIRKTKFPGQAYVLASSTGYRTTAKTLEEYKATGGKILWVKGHELGENLRPQRFDGTTVHPAEVILPWRLVDDNGNFLDPKNYMDKDGYLNLPEEILTLNGFRIPTQGINSMSHIKVVGFLPEGVQNIILAPGEYVAQMGSDFDVDKLYTYSKFYKVNKEGQIEVLTEENAGKNEKDKVLINKIIDIQTKVLSAPSEEIQSMLAKPLDYGMFDDGLADEIYDKTAKSRSGMFVSPLYQLDNYVKASTAKDAVGAFSLSSTFNSMIQTADFDFILPISENIFSKDGFLAAFRGDSLYLTAGRYRGTNVLNSTQTLRGKRTKADVISAVQSAAVDNENKRFLEKVNLNQNTMPVIAAMAHLGFEEDHIFYLINQPTLLKDSSILATSNPAEIQAGLSAFIADKVKEIQLQEPNTPETVIQNRIIDNIKSAMTADVEQWKQALIDNDPYFQAAAILKGKIYYLLGSKIRDYQKLLNLDSSGLGEDFYSTWIYEKKFKELFDSNDPIVPLIADVVDTPTEDSYTLFGKHYIPKKLSSILYFEELKLFTDSIISDERFSIYETPVMNSIIEEIVRNKLGKNDLKYHPRLTITDWLSVKDSIRDIESSLVKFLMSNSDLFKGNMIQTTLELDNLETGIANKIKEIKKTTLGKQNKFLKALDVIWKKNVETGLSTPEVIFRASRKINDSDESFSTALNNLYQNTNRIGELNFSPHDLVLDLIRYNFIKDPFQGATNFGRFIDPVILKDLGIHTQLKKFDLTNPEKTIGMSMDPIMMSTFVRQYIQNNPDMAYHVSSRGLDYKELIKIAEADTLPFIPKGDNKMIAHEKRIVYYGGFLFQANGEEFVKIPKLFNEYDANKSFIHKSAYGQGDQYTFRYYHNHQNAPVVASFLGENVTTQRLTKAISDSDPYAAFNAIAEDPNSPIMYKSLAATMANSPAFADVLFKFDSNVGLARTVAMKQFNVGAFNPEQWKKLPLILKQKYFLHEAIHTSTMKLIKEYLADPSSVTEEQRRALERLEIFRQIVATKIKERIGKPGVKQFEAKLGEYFKGVPGVDFTELEEILYATRDLDEFAAAIMTDQGTQEALNSIMLKENKSLFDIFKKILLEILQSLGIDVSKGNILLSDIAVKDVITLIESQDNFLMSDESYQVFELSEDNPIFSNC